MSGNGIVSDPTDSLVSRELLALATGSGFNSWPGHFFTYLKKYQLKKCLLRIGANFLTKRCSNCMSNVEGKPF